LTRRERRLSGDDWLGSGFWAKLEETGSHDHQGKKFVLSAFIEEGKGVRETKKGKMPTPSHGKPGGTR